MLYYLKIVFNIFLAQFQITMLELAIAKIKVTSGELSPGPEPTFGHQRFMTNEEKAARNHTMEELRLKAHVAIEENAELERLLHAQCKQLEAAKDAAVEHQHLVRQCQPISLSFIRFLTDSVFSYIFSGELHLRDR